MLKEFLLILSLSVYSTYSTNLQRVQLEKLLIDHLRLGWYTCGFNLTSIAELNNDNDVDDGLNNDDNAPVNDSSSGDGDVDINDAEPANDDNEEDDTDTPKQTTKNFRSVKSTPLATRYKGIEVDSEKVHPFKNKSLYKHTLVFPKVRIPSVTNTVNTLGKLQMELFRWHLSGGPIKMFDIWFPQERHKQDR